MPSPECTRVGSGLKHWCGPSGGQAVAAALVLPRGAGAGCFGLTATGQMNETPSDRLLRGHVRRAGRPHTRGRPAGHRLELTWS